MKATKYIILTKDGEFIEKFIPLGYIVTDEISGARKYSQSKIDKIKNKLNSWNLTAKESTI